MTSMDKRGYIVDSEQKMREVATAVLGELETRGARTAVLALDGDLGSGKTTFTKALARQLGILEPVTSPTFVIQKSYHVENNKDFKKLVHIDAYRLESGADMEVLDFNKTLAEPNTLIVIEWPENIKSALPKDLVDITFKYINDTTRKVCINATM